jgi:DNA ligase (NAD+)
MKKLKTLQDYLDFLIEADEYYYSNNEPKYPDSLYDQIKDEFLEKYPDHIYKKQVGHTSQDGIKVKHKQHMGSQGKVNNLIDLTKWHETNLKKLNVKEFSYMISEKLDGLSLSLEYNNGKLIQGLLRGDGIYGDDITNNVKLIKNIPHNIKNKGNIFVRGELIIKKTVFEEINMLKQNNDEKQLSNPRNAVAGIIRRLDGVDCDKVSFVAYDVNLDLHENEKFDLISKLKFETPFFTVANNLEQVQLIWEDYEKTKRNSCIYEIDGLVITIDDKDFQHELGIIDNRPRFARAYKFLPQIVVTKIEDIVWQTGRTGRITPVANVTQVKASGVMVSNVTLHNLSEVLKNKITKNSIIEIKRAGDVIPKFERIIESESDTPIIPEECPSCHSKTVAEETFLMCYNNECPAKNYEKLLYWVKSLEIKGFGDELVLQLYEKGLVTKISDFYKLTESELIKLDRVGQKLAIKVLKELNTKTTISFPIFIKALGISNFSDKTAELIEEKFNIQELLELTDISKLTSINGIGDIVANAILSIKTRKNEIKDLLSIITIKEKEKPISALMTGINVCFTGVRDDNVENFIVSNGGKIVSGVSKNLTILVAKDISENSSKLVKAKELGIQILTMPEFKEKYKIA